MLCGIVGVLGVCLECDLSRAKRAGSTMRRRSEHEDVINTPFDVEPEDLDAIVILALDRLLPCIELLPFVNVFAACVAAPGEQMSAEDCKKGDRSLH